MKKTLVSLFALLAMGSTAFAADNNAPVTSNPAEVKCTVIKALTVEPGDAAELGVVVADGNAKVLSDKSITFTITGEEGYDFQYTALTAVTSSLVAGLTVDIEDEDATNAASTDIELDADGVTLTFPINSVTAATTVTSDEYTIQYTTTVNYVNI